MFGSNLCGNPSDRYFTENRNVNLNAALEEKESTKSAGFILLGPLMPVSHLSPIRPVISVCQNGGQIN